MESPLTAGAQLASELLLTAMEVTRIFNEQLLEDEQTKPRRIFALSRPTPVDMFQVARSLAFLRRLGPLGRVVDAEYGSATFVAARDPAQLELSVSTTGLLFRPVGQAVQGAFIAPATKR